MIPEGCVDLGSMASKPRFPALARLVEFAVAFGENLCRPTLEPVAGRDVADGRVQSFVVVLTDEQADHSPGVLERERRFRTDAIGLECFVKSFQLTIALGVKRRGSHMGHAREADELFEVARDELRAVVGNDSGIGMGKLFPCPL